MMRPSHSVFATALLSFALSGTSSAFMGRSAGLGFSYQKVASPSGTQALYIQVDAATTRAPITDASVTFENITDQTSSQALTNAQGLAEFETLNLIQASDEFMVTIEKAGFTKVTVALGQFSGSVQVQLDPIVETVPSEVVLTGTATGWEPLSDSSKVYAGLVFRTLDANELLNFNPSGLISPLSDTINVMGSHDIPSNFVLPKQSVTVGFFPVGLSKPGYRLPLFAGTERVAVLQGKVPVSALMNAQGGDSAAMLGLIDQMSFSRVGVSAPVALSAANPVEAKATHDLDPQVNVSLTKPSFAADVFVAGLQDVAGGLRSLLPTDVRIAMKAADAQIKAVKVSTPKAALGSGTHVLAAAVESVAATQGQTPDIKRVSGIFAQNVGSAVSGSAFLSVNPLTGGVQIPAQIDLAANTGGPALLVFSKAIGHSASGVPAQQLLWKVIALPEAGAVSIPTASLQSEKQLVVARVQMDLGQTAAPDQWNGATAFQQLRRFGASMAKFGSRAERDAGVNPLQFLFGNR